MKCAVYADTFGQDSTFKFIKSFIPVGFTILDSTAGDLNRDNYPDLVLVLKSTQEDVEPELNRPLLLLFGGAGGRYQLAASNDSVVLCKSCGGALGDPYQGTTIKRGYFSIEHYGGSSWRWTRIITFRFDPAKLKFILHRDAGESFHSSEPNRIKTTLTNKHDFGKLLFTEYSFSK